MWLPLKLKGFPERYEVSDKGKVRNKESGVEKTQYIEKGVGYKCLSFRYRPAKLRVTKRVHRLVAETFLSNPLNLPCVNHIDGDKGNNTLKNLEWCTHSYNLHHAKVTGLNLNYGETHGNSKLTKEIAEHIVGEEGTCKALGEKYGVSGATICLIKNKKRYATGYEETRSKNLLKYKENKIYE